MTQAANLAALGTNVDTAGDVSLTTGVTGTLPKANLPTGAILQVVQTVVTTAQSTTSSPPTKADVGLNVIITPTSATSKILVLISQNLYIYREFAFQYGSIQLLRNTPSANTVVKNFAQVMNITTGIPASGSYPYFDLQTVLGLSYLDSPATTSSTTYKMQVFTTAGTFCVNRSGRDADTSGYDGRGVSSITVMEIAG